MNYHVAVQDTRIPTCSFAKMSRRTLATRPHVAPFVCAIDEINFEVPQLVHPFRTKQRFDQDQAIKMNCRRERRQDRSGEPVEQMNVHAIGSNGHAHASKRMTNPNEFFALKIDWGGKRGAAQHESMRCFGIFFAPNWT